MSATRILRSQWLSVRVWDFQIRDYSFLFVLENRKDTGDEDEYDDASDLADLLAQMSERSGSIASDSSGTVTPVDESGSTAEDSGRALEQVGPDSTGPAIEDVRPVATPSPVRLATSPLNSPSPTTSAGTPSPCSKSSNSKGFEPTRAPSSQFPSDISDTIYNVYSCIWVL